MNTKLVSVITSDLMLQARQISLFTLRKTHASSSSKLEENFL